MNHNALSISPLTPLVLYSAAVAVIVCGMVVTSHFAGGRRKHRPTTPPYESGMTPTGSTHIHLSVSYYLVAMFFLIFDLEAAFIFAWAVSLKQAGWPAFVEMLVFIGVLMAGLFYLWHEGALDWGAAGRRTTPVQRAAARSAGRSGNDRQD
jgi:NADH-quinone oxidoreductase subunit A